MVQQYPPGTGGSKFRIFEYSSVYTLNLVRRSKFRIFEHSSVYTLNLVRRSKFRIFEHSSVYTLNLVRSGGEVYMGYRCSGIKF